MWRFTACFVTAWPSQIQRMTMLRLKPAQRAVFADKLPDVANVILAGLVVGQALSERPFSPVLAVAGMGAWVLLMTLAVLFAASEEQS